MKFKKLYYIFIILIFSCSEKANVLHFDFKNKEDMYVVLERLNKYNLNLGYFQESVKRLEKISTSKPIFRRYYNKKGIFDKQVSSIFNLSSSPTLEVYIYRSAFETELEYEKYITEIKKIAMVRNE